MTSAAAEMTIPSAVFAKSRRRQETKRFGSSRGPRCCVSGSRPGSCPFGRDLGGDAGLVAGCCAEQLSPTSVEFLNHVRHYAKSIPDWYLLSTTSAGRYRSSTRASFTRCDGTAEAGDLTRFTATTKASSLLRLPLLTAGHERESIIR
jgi:hypothetical protein